MKSHKSQPTKKPQKPKSRKATHPEKQKAILKKDNKSSRQWPSILKTSGEVEGGGSPPPPMMREEARSCK